jgi:2,3-bisphosphoglycerate-independent phosphoglycerate mutase
MSSGKVTECTINEINAKKYDFICLNFANTDMVGHTGDFKAVVNAVEKVDTCLDKIVKACKKNNYVIVVIADHGNAEYMVNEDGSINTSHTTNKVPIFVINSKFSKLKNGNLCDVAPTILSLMKINIPTEMTGRNLLS